ncbi:MAG: efflux RND transporter permease subunit [Planctomycetota bacterium]
MQLTRAAISHRPVTLFIAAVMVFVGASTFLTMSRRENPRMTIRTALVETRWPGASAEKVEDLVTEPIEDAIYQIEEVETIESKSRTGYSKIDVELIDDVGEGEIDQVWDKVRDRVQAVQGTLPSDCGVPFVNSDFGDVSSVCLVLHQTIEDPDADRYTYRELELMADELETALKSIESVASVTMFGVPGETITLEIDAGTWARLGITRDDLARALDDQNVANSGAVLVTDDLRYPLRPSGELVTLEDIGAATVASADDGRAVAIRDLPFELVRSHDDPRRDAVRFTSPETRAPRALLLGVTMKENRNVVKLGARVDEVVERTLATYLPEDVAVTRVNDLPRQVDSLVSDFMESLWQAIAIVLGVAFVMMGWRPALVMATAIPLSMISTIALMPRFGVELEQFAIASLIIVLGMVVDNAIVVTDNVQRLIDDGVPRDRAAAEGAEGLSRAILSSTLTTVAAFLPMLTISGETGEYMRSLPIVVSATLLSSYVVAMTVTPLMASTILRPSKTAGKPVGRLGRLYTAVVKRCVAARILTLGATAAAFASSLSLLPAIGTQFFPGGIRDQLFIDVRVPVGSSLEATERAIAQVEDIVLRTSRTEIDGEPVERLANATSFVGSGGPRMLLSLDPDDSVPHTGMVLVNTTGAELSRPWVEELRREVRSIPGAEIKVRPYELGPPIDNPVEFRFTGEDLDVIRAAADEMLGVFHATEGLLTPSHDWHNRSYEIDLDVDVERAYLAGVSSASISRTLQDLYDGGSLTTLREGDHLVDIELRLRRDERRDVSSLESVHVKGERGAVPLGSIVEARSDWADAVIARRNRRRTLTIGAQVAPEFLSNAVTETIRPRLEPIVRALPPGYELETAGEAEETVKSQGGVVGAFKISVVLIFFVLLVQYNSLTKPIVVLLAFPLSLIGALLGLFATGWPLGFMPLLGIVALAGTVINNAIVLIDFIESMVAEGAELREAVARAGLARMQPILLTTLTTIGGLLPLALFGGPMWAGMSWAMIFGLALSTVLTLVVTPTVYVLFAERFGMKVAS